MLVVGTAYASVFTKRDGQSAVSLNLRAHLVSLLNPSRGPKVIHGTQSSLESITDFTPRGADLQSQDDKDLDGEDEKISLVDGQDGAELYEYILDYHGLSEPLTDHPFDGEEYFDVWDEISSMDDYVWEDNLGWDSR